MDGFSVAAFLVSPKKTTFNMELLVQAPGDNTPLILHPGVITPSVIS